MSRFDQAMYRTNEREASRWKRFVALIGESASSAIRNCAEVCSDFILHPQVVIYIRRTGASPWDLARNAFRSEIQKITEVNALVAFATNINNSAASGAEKVAA